MENWNKILTKTEAAYLAGFIDGEGCIHIKRRSKTNAPALVLSVSNTNKLVILWLCKLFNHTFHKRRLKNGTKDAYVFVVTGKKAGYILEQLLPYFKIKKDRAKLAIKFSKRIKGTGYKLTNKEVEIRLKFRSKIQELNRVSENRR